MPTKDTLEIDVNVGEGVKSMKTLKAEFAAMQTELDGLTPGTQKYIDTLKRLGAVKDEIGDLKAEIQAFAGTDAKVAAFGNVIGGIASGFQAAQGAAALFGAESEDVQKALLKVQAAAALADGIKGIAAMGDSLKVASNVAKQLITQILGVETVTKVAAAAQRVWNAVMAANPIGLLIVGITALAGAIYGLTKAFEDNATEADKAAAAAARLKSQNDELIKNIDNQITALSGLKENEEEIIRLKERSLQISIQTAKTEFLAASDKIKEQEKELGFFDSITAKSLELVGVENAREALTKANSAESRKLAKEKYDELNKLEAEYTKFNNEQQQKQIDKNKEFLNKKLQQQKEYQDQLDILNKEAHDKEVSENEADSKRRIQEAENEAKYFDQQEKLKNEIEEDDKKRRKEREDKEKAQKKIADKEDLEKRQQAEQKSIEALTSLSAGYFAFRLRAAQGNEAEELKIRKRQFQVDKAFNLARAIQDGIRSVQGALANTSTLGPGAIALAAVNAAIAAGNVAQIAATEFNGGGSSASAPSFSGGNANFSQAPNISPASNNRTALNEDGTVANGQKTSAPIQAYVVESQSAATTKRINKLTNQSKIG